MKRLRQLIALALLLTLAFPLTSRGDWFKVSDYKMCLRAKTNPTAADTQAVFTDALYIEDCAFFQFRVYANSASTQLDSVDFIQVSNNDSTWDTITSGGIYTYIDSVGGKDLKSGGGKCITVRPSVTNSTGAWGYPTHRFARLLLIQGQAATVPSDSIFADGRVYR